MDRSCCIKEIDKYIDMTDSYLYNCLYEADLG